MLSYVPVAKHIAWQMLQLVVLIQVCCCAQVGMAYKIFSEPFCWFDLILVYLLTFSIRYAERSARWLFWPNDNMILVRLTPSELVCVATP